MTYKELIAKLNTLTEDQLNQTVAFEAEGELGYFIKSVHIYDEDYVDTGDEFLDPVSAVEDFDPDKHPVRIKKGTVRLFS